MYEILHTLVDRGWIPLVAMATLLGYSTTSAIYQRQRGANPIPVVRVGGINRVVEEVVIESLENAHYRSHAEVVLSVYRKIKHG